MDDKLDQAVNALQETVENPDPHLLTRLENLQGRMEAVNSAMPETKAFLEARGLTSVRELDAKGRQELVEHLQNTRRLLSEAPSSSRPS